MQWSIEIENSILEDLFKINAHHWILSHIYSHGILKFGVYGELVIFVLICYFLLFNYKKTPKRIKTLQMLSHEECILPKVLKIQWSIEIENSILEDLFKINAYHWILSHIYSQGILKFGVYATISPLTHTHTLSLSLSHLSSLRTLKAHRVPILINGQPKSLSLATV